MTRQRNVTVADFGELVGESLGQGFAEAMEAAFETLRVELEPLGLDLVEILRTEAKQALALAPAAVETILQGEGARTCEASGCDRGPVARGLCRRHYARTIYQERRAKQSPDGVFKPRRAARPAQEEEGEEVDKKIVVPVAPIVRRKKSEGEAPAQTSRVAAAAPQQGGVTAESVARFFGLSK